jgi:hypothetical protein
MEELAIKLLIFHYAVFNVDIQCLICRLPILQLYWLLSCSRLLYYTQTQTSAGTEYTSIMMPNRRSYALFFKTEFKKNLQKYRSRILRFLEPFWWRALKYLLSSERFFLFKTKMELVVEGRKVACRCGEADCSLLY